mgnify:CR=1 FL=1
MSIFEIQLNNETKKIEAEADTPLLWAVRDIVGLTGTKFGCGIAPAVADAIFRLNGKRMHKLPFKHELAES